MFDPFTSGIGDYYKREYLGKGAMGEVYGAYDSNFSEGWAIRRFNPQISSDDKLKYSLYAPTELNSRLRHSQISRITDVFEEEGVRYLVMEFAEGINLEKLVSAAGPLPVERAMPIFLQICDVLHYAHFQGVSHRGINPHNVMIDVANADQVTILDFGLAHFLESLTEGKYLLPQYKSPEQLKNPDHTDHRSDIYSAGLLLYYMLTGRHPELKGENIGLDLQGVPDEAAQLILKFTQPDKDERPVDIVWALYQDNDIKQEPMVRGYPALKTYPQIEPQKPEMVYVEGGSFVMGSLDGWLDERPIHRVNLSSFYISKYQVTEIEWWELMRKGWWERPTNLENLPAYNVSWCEAIEYCNKLSEMEGLQPCYSGSGYEIVCDWTANGYRLPTEAEWEYAARGGKLSKGYVYSGSDNLYEVAWYNYKRRPVGQKKANELGIHDMSGNVMEWCWDWYAKDYYGKSPKSDPKGPEKGWYRVMRGGSYRGYNMQCRVSDRYYNIPRSNYNSLGFRLVRGLAAALRM